MKLPRLYARTNTGAVQCWEIEVADDAYRTFYGQLDGKIQTTNWTKCYTTNPGRANERNPQEQAVFEAQALWKKKTETGYFENLADIDQQGYVQPMLAKKYEDYKDELTWPVYAQPKSDGCRCIVTSKGMFSRNGKEFKSSPHILKHLQPFFAKYPNAVLDGELYNHDLKHDFNKIMSLVKKTKPTPADLEESAQLVEYWIYDLVDPTLTWNERLNFIENEFCNSESVVRLMPTLLARNQESLDEMYEIFLRDGFEGQMVRIDEHYENKRSKYLLKRKEFQDREYVILAIEEGEGNKSGMAGAMVFENELGYKFNANIKGTREFITEIWNNKDSYIGRLATVSFFNETPDRKVPRFPYVIKIREDFDV